MARGLAATKIAIASKEKCVSARMVASGGKMFSVDQKVKTISKDYRSPRFYISPTQGNSAFDLGMKGVCRLE